MTDLAFVPLSAEQVAMMNALIIRSARKEVYSSIPDESVWVRLNSALLVVPLAAED